MSNWLIDNKGKLFRKINIFDFTVLVFFLCVIMMFYWAWKLYQRPRQAKITWEQKYEEEIAKEEKFKKNFPMCYKRHYNK